MVDWSGPQTSRNRSHGTVKHSVKLLGVGATAPDWCAVLCSRVDQCQGGDFHGLGSGSHNYVLSDKNGRPLILSDKNRGNVDSTCHQPVLYDVIIVNNCYL